MKTIRESLKIVLSMCSSVMVLFVAGCGDKPVEPVGSVSLDREMIERIQTRIPDVIPFEIKEGTIRRDSSKSDNKFIFGNFEAVAIATEDLYELVPQGTDLKEFGINYATDGEINDLKTKLETKLEKIRNSGNEFSKTNEQYVAATNKFHSHLDNIEKLKPYSFATNGVAKDKKISVKGTVYVVLSDEKKWEDYKIEITETDLSKPGRKLFKLKNKNESELIIEKSGTNWVIKGNVLANRKKTVDDAEKAVEEAVEEAEQTAAEALEAENFENGGATALSVEPEAEPNPEDETGGGGLTLGTEPLKMPTQWYDESKINEIIRENSKEAMRILRRARDNEPKNSKHHYWSAFAYYEEGKLYKQESWYGLARNSMGIAVKFNPEYLHDQKVMETECTKCKGIKFETCPKSDCTKGKLKPKKCNDCNEGKPRGSKKSGEKCKKCDGNGNMVQYCKDCGGTGEIEKTCQACNSTGKFFWQALELQ
jgi:Archaea-specific RecJ-like exonuclease, contains DnaJ-type Zn finger domain